MIWLALVGFVLTMIGYIQWVFVDSKDRLARPLLFRTWQVVFWVGVALLVFSLLVICARLPA